MCVNSPVNHFAGDTDQEQMQFIFEDGPKAEEAELNAAKAADTQITDTGGGGGDRDTDDLCDNDDEIGYRKPLFAVSRNSTQVLPDQENAETDV